MTARNLFGDLSLEATQQSVRAAVETVADAVPALATDATAQATVDLLSAVQNPSKQAITVSGTRDKFRDGFTTGTVSQPVDPAEWTLINELPDTGNGQGHIVAPGGDSQGAAYLRVSLSPFSSGTAVHLSSASAWTVPIRHAWGASMSQRITGQEVVFGLAEAAPDGSSDQLGLNRVAQPGDLAISGSVVANGSIFTVTVPNHGLKGNDRVVLIGNTEKRLNIGPVYVTPLDANTFTVPNGLTSGTYAAGGFVRIADPSALLNNCALQLWGDNTTTSQATYVTRRNGTKPRVSLSQGAASSAPTQINTSPYSDAWLAAGPSEIWANIDEVTWRSWPDGLSGMSGYVKFQQSIPDETTSYRLYCRAKNLDNLSRPIARIISAVKSASATATITTDVPHGLIVGDIVGVTGIRDQTNFAGTNGAVLSVPTTTTLTVTVGGSGTATDLLGGSLWLDRGSINTPGLVNGAISAIASTIAGVMNVSMTGTVSGVAIGDYVNLHGLNGTGAAQYEGAYKVMRLNGTTLELAYTGSTFSNITTGGAVIRRTDVRLHFARILGHTRLMTEVIGGRGSTSDGNNSVPVSITASTSVSVNPATLFSSAEPVTTTSLGANAVYTQPTVQITSGGTTIRPSRTRIMVMHTAGQALGTLALQESADNITFRETWRCPIPSDSNYHTFEVPAHLAYQRLVFTNGATAQTAFWLSTALLRSEAPDVLSTQQNLQFLMTPVAGSAFAASASVSYPTFDLGPNHSWSTIRTWMYADQAGTAYVDESVDGSTWRTIGSGVAVTAGGTYRAEQQIITRYLRLRYVNGATAVTAVTLGASLMAI